MSETAGKTLKSRAAVAFAAGEPLKLSLIHISEPTRRS